MSGVKGCLKEQHERRRAVYFCHCDARRPEEGIERQHPAGSDERFQDPASVMLLGKSSAMGVCDSFPMP
jgi:hypothetical protein